MRWPQLLLPDVQRPLVEYLRFCIFALLFVERCQVSKRVGYPRMLWPQLLLPNTQCLPVERFCLCVFALFRVEYCQAVKWVSY